MKKIVWIEMMILVLLGGCLLMQFKQGATSTAEGNQPAESMAVQSAEQVETTPQTSNTPMQQENAMKEEIEDAKTLPDQTAAGQEAPIKLEQEAESILSGKVISIDAGHQSHGNSEQEPIGPGSLQTKAKVSSGTRGVATGKYEYELNLEVALKLQSALQAKGAKVCMVRTTNDVDISNAERAKMANEAHADLSLRIHADGSDNSNVSGFSILVPGGEFVSKDVISKSYAIAEYMNEYLSQGISNTSRGIVTRTDLTGFNWSEVPAVLVEMGFMSNPEEDQRMSTESFQEDLTSAIVQALEAYYEMQ